MTDTTLAPVEPEGPAAELPEHQSVPARQRDRAAWVAAAAVTFVLSLACWLRHRNFWSGGLDLGVFDQGVWLMSRGLTPMVTLNGRNLFADHLSPVLLLFVPLYRLAATPLWLLVAQAAAIGATVFPMRMLARDEGVAPWIATAAVVGGAPLLSAAFFDFHPATLAVPFVAWAIVGARRGDLRMTMLASLGVIACRAELAWILVGVAIVARPELRKKLLLIVPPAMILAYAIPAMLGARGTFQTHYGQLGTGPTDALLHPWRIALDIVSGHSLRSFALLFLPVGFLPLLRPRWALAAVVAALPIAMSQWPGTSLPWFHYAAPMYPLAIAGALVALAKVEHRLVKPQWIVASLALGLAVASPLSPQAPAAQRVWTALRPHPGHLGRALAAVEPGQPVAASNELLAHLTHRREAWLYPSPFRAGDPAELYPTPNAKASSQIHVIVSTSIGAARLGRELGFKPSPIAGVSPDRVYIGRRP